MALAVLKEELSQAPSPSAPIDFFTLTRSDLAEVLRDRFGLPQFRAQQLFDWVYKKENRDPLTWSNVAREMRSTLASEISFPTPTIRSRQISIDGTRKYLFEVSGGDLVESVMIKQPKRMTLCLSSQVGCAMGCTFCRTGTMGLKRNLSTSEILQQVLGVIADAKNFGDMFTNIVFMGMGEPLHNFDNVINAVKILSDDTGLGIGPRRITISTSGLVPAIKKFGASGVKASLAVSLNATTDEVRSQIMPVNNRFNLETLLTCLREFPLEARRRITIEYVMLGGINDTDQDLARLPKLLRGIPSKINLIPYNLNAGLGFNSPKEGLPARWQKELNKHNLVATIRWSKGADINAACGQLVTESQQKRRTVIGNAA